MDKCPKCGAEPEDTSKFAFDSWACESWHSPASDRFVESLKCCRRQLAAANTKLESSQAALRDVMNECAERAGGLEDALRSLVNEVRASAGAFEDAMREAVGNTNYACLMDKVEQARKALEVPDEDVS